MWNDQSEKVLVSSSRNRRYGSWSQGMEEGLLDLGSQGSFSVRVECACLGWVALLHASPPEARPTGMAASFVSKSSIVNGIVPSCGISPLSLRTWRASNQETTAKALRPLLFTRMTRSTP